MKKLIIIAAMFMGVAAFAQNQTAGGGISADLLKEISKGYEGNALRTSSRLTSIFLTRLQPRDAPTRSLPAVAGSSQVLTCSAQK